MRLTAFLYVFFISFNSFSSCPIKASGEWILDESVPVRGVILMYHGLNLRPDRMEPLAKSMAKKGYAVFNSVLTGHVEGSYPKLEKPLKYVWKRDFQSSYCEAKLKATDLGIPFHFLGFSLGALVAGAQISTGNYVFDKIIFLAPPIVVSKLTSLIKLLFFLPNSFPIPSINHKTYRAYKKLPLAVYRTLFEFIAIMKQADSKNLNNKVYIFTHGEDELVSFQGLQNFIKTKKLTQWQMSSVENQETLLSPIYNHLIIDGPSLGNKAWNKLQMDLWKILK